MGACGGDRYCDRGSDKCDRGRDRDGERCRDRDRSRDSDKCRQKFDSAELTGEYNDLYGNNFEFGD